MPCIILPCSLITILSVDSLGRRAFKNISQKSADPNVANKWKMLPKEAYHDHCAKAAQASPPSLMMAGQASVDAWPAPQKLLC